MHRALLLILIALLASGCAAGLATFAGDEATVKLQHFATRQAAEMETFGALLRVKIAREGKIDDLRAELFSRGDSLLSIYVRGFLGKSVFKAVLAGEALTVYFPDQRQHFQGRRDDLASGSLADAGHLIDLLLTLAAGQVPVPGHDDWQYQVANRKGLLELRATDLRFAHQFTLRWQTDVENFPYTRLERLDWVSDDEALRLNLRALDQHYNREIPDSKFVLEISSSSTAISEAELATALTAPQ